VHVQAKTNNNTLNKLFRFQEFLWAQLIVCDNILALSFHSIRTMSTAQKQSKCQQVCTVSTLKFYQSKVAKSAKRMYLPHEKIPQL
jgi:hypothetical protein